MTAIVLNYASGEVIIFNDVNTEEELEAKEIHFDNCEWMIVDKLIIRGE